MRQRESGLYVPEPAEIVLTSAHVTEFGKHFFLTDGGRVPPPIAGGASFSDAYEVSVLEHIVGKKELALVTATWIALTTVVPTDSSTGVTITEASYTGYARKEVKTTDFAAAVSGSPSSIATNKELVFAACTGGTSTIIGWALTNNSKTSEGAVIMWGTATSTVISTTQTPPTVASAALSLTLD